MALNGGKAVSYRDLRNDAAVKRTARLQRLMCRRCSAVSYLNSPVLKQGFRITPPLFSAAAQKCTETTFTDVAETYGLSVKTVRAIWNRRLEETSSVNYSPLSTLLSLRLGAGTFSAVRTDTETVSLFRNPLDPFLVTWLAEHSGGTLFTDWRHAAAAYSVSSSSLNVVCNRFSINEWLEGNLPTMLKRAEPWLDREEKRILRNITPVLRKDDIIRTADEDTLLCDIISSPLREICEAADRFRKIWMVGLCEKARNLYTNWKNSLSPMCMHVFSPALRLISSVRETIFNPDYGLSRPFHEMSPFVTDNIPVFSGQAALQCRAVRVTGNKAVQSESRPVTRDGLTP